jgi:tRNA (guanine37-N1)-methyltransferase
MVNFHIITIFPELFGAGSYTDHTLLKRAKDAGLISVTAHDLRLWGAGIHRKVDDIPYGGGPGMVLGVEPIYKAVKHATKGKAKKSRVVLFSTRGKKFDSNDAERLANYQNIVLICGRYEGVDERVAEYIADEELSLGDFILMGGELPAMAVIEATSRFVPGILGKTESLESIKGSYPAYTRPEIFKPTKNKEWKVPPVLLSGNHKEIENWRKK